MRVSTSSSVSITGASLIALASACAVAPARESTQSSENALKCDTCGDPGPSPDPTPTGPSAREPRARRAASAQTSNATGIAQWDVSARGDWTHIAETDGLGVRRKVVSVRVARGLPKLDGSRTADMLEIHGGGGVFVGYSDGTVSVNTLRQATITALQHAQGDFANAATSTACAAAMAQEAQAVTALIAAVLQLIVVVPTPPSAMATLALAMQAVSTAVTAVAAACAPPPAPPCTSGSDCPARQVCNAGACEPMGCSTDAQCPAGNKCNGQECVWIPCGGSCGPGATCVNESCQLNNCGGKCPQEQCDPIANACTGVGSGSGDPTACDPNDLCCTTPNDPSCGGDGSDTGGGGGATGSCGGDFYGC